MSSSALRRLVFVGALAGAAILASAGAAPAGSPSPAHGVRAVQRALDSVVAAGAPGAIALVRVGDRTYRFSSGNGSLAPERPIRAGDLARIGGVTKSYTAAVVLQLVGEGRLALGDTVERWVPGVISNGSAITVRQLLNHTSGIFDYVQDPRVLGPYFENYPSSLTLPFDPVVGVRIAAEHGPLYAPGTGWNYSNTNYLLLAMIVEAVTGRSFGSQLERRVFRPLRLDHTSYPTSPEIRGRYVHGYFQFEDTLLDFSSLNPTLLGASGGILSNAQDVTTFYRALLRGRLIDANLLASMRTIDPVATNPPDAIPDAGFLGGGWGLGLLRETFPCGRAWGHDTENPGYMTAAWNSDHATRQVVVIVNTNVAHDDPIAAAMRDVLVATYCGAL